MISFEQRRDSVRVIFMSKIMDNKIDPGFAVEQEIHDSSTYLVTINQIEKAASLKTILCS